MISEQRVTSHTLTSDVSFSITRKTPLFIYGAGSLGLATYNKLFNANYNVIGIIDKEGFRGQKTSASIFRIGEEPFLRNACICICLYNGLQHSEVARQLRLKGYSKILFLPLYINSKNAKRMTGIYNRFISGAFSGLSDIPAYDELWKITVEDYILREAGAFVTVNIPISQVYTAKRKYYEAHPFDGYAPEILDVPQGFCTDSPLCMAADYMDDKLKERADLYAFFEQALFDGLDFFIDSAPPARFNTNGYFNLLDGHHRTSYLMHRGFHGIPVRVLRAEYERYFNQDVANTIMCLCKDLGALPFRIDHPAFTRIPIIDCKSGINDETMQRFQGYWDKLRDGWKE